MSEAVRSSIQSLLLSVFLLSSCTLQAFAYFHPDEGRWINRDPMDEFFGPHIYLYVDNSPTVSIRLVFTRGKRITAR